MSTDTGHDIGWIMGLPAVDSATLRGPAHPDDFRVKVGRFNDRWYVDPLPGCELAPAAGPDDIWPSVSGVKKAAGRDWTWTSFERAAAYLETRRNELEGMNAAEIHGRLMEINKAGMGRASGRGTSIHEMMEGLAAGQPPGMVAAEAQPYVPACQQFLDQHQPEWLLSEVVTINRTVGYGGTFDAVLRIDGKVYLVDWKTRKAGKHGAYPEEGWQLAAYANAEYMIVERDGDAVRTPVPQLDGALIVSICPEGAKVYPVDLDKAWVAFQTLRNFWEGNQLTVIGRPVRLAKTERALALDRVWHPERPAIPEPEPTPEDEAPEPVAAEPTEPQPIGPLVDVVTYRLWVTERMAAVRENKAALRALADVWPAHIPGLRTEHEHTESELEIIAEILDQIERQFGMPFTSPDPRRQTFTIEPEPDPLPDPVDEGREMDEEDVAAILKKVDDLDPAVRSVLNGWASEAHRAGVGFSIRMKPSQRRFEIYRACLNLAPLAGDADVVLAAIDYVQPDGQAAQLDEPIGLTLGRLTTDEANRLADAAHAVTSGRLVLNFRDDGTAYLTETKESSK